MELITVHRALSQLKTTKARIDKIRELTFVTYTKGQSEVAMGKPLSEVSTQLKANYDSSEKLIENFMELKLAIIRNNSGITEETTGVQKFKIQDKEYTVAEIIAIQTYGLPIYQEFISVLSKAYNQIQAKVEYQNQLTDSNSDKIVSSVAGKSSDAKITAEEFNAIMDVYRKNNEFKIVDPIGLEQKIKELTDKYEQLSVAIDSALSEANALNKISVNL